MSLPMSGGMVNLSKKLLTQLLKRGIRREAKLKAKKTYKNLRPLCMKLTHVTLPRPMSDDFNEARRWTLGNQVETEPTDMPGLSET